MTTQVGTNSPRMYKLDPYYDSSESIELPGNMYKMNSYYGENKTKSGQSSNVFTTSPEASQLLRRQQSILLRLQELTREVDRLKNTAGPQRKQPAKQTTATSSLPTALHPAIAPETLGETLRDLVISASPTSPPLSLLVLQQLLSEQYRVLACCHTHSSVKQVPEQLKKLFQTNGVPTDRGSHQLAFTLIWKEAEKPGPSLMVSPCIQTAIRGEGNIARYLARLLSPAYDAADAVRATEVDVLVDLAGQLLRGNAKEKAAVTRTLNGKLGKSHWLVGDDLSLADAVLWSAAQQTGQAASAPANVKKWLDACAQHPAFQLAVRCLNNNN